MHPRIQEILVSLDDELDALRQAVEEVPMDARTRRPAEGQWSVADVLEHLALTERAILKLCERQLAAAREAGLGGETETSSVREMLPVERVASRERRLIAPDRLQPTGRDAESAWRDVEAARARFRAFVVSCDGLALEQVSAAHPMLGSLNLYQWFLFAAGHHRRHAAQVREIAAASS